MRAIASHQTEKRAIQTRSTVDLFENHHDDRIQIEILSRIEGGVQLFEEARQDNRDYLIPRWESGEVGCWQVFGIGLKRCA